MTTTIIKDSIVGDNWIRQTAAAVPVQRIRGADGAETGDILTGPVRLGYNDLFTLPQKRQGQTSEPKFGSKIIFTPLTDFAIFYEEYYKVCGREFAEHYNNGQYYGLRSPFRDQAELMKYKGFTPGCVFMTCTSKFKPPVVDTRYNPIVDPSKVYAGVWAICALKAYAYKDPKNKGVAFGLQSVMIIGDDTPLSGGGPDARQQFAGVQGLTAPIVRPDIASGMPTGAAPPPAAGIPGYTAPGGGMPTGAPNAPNAPFVPQQTWTPPAPAAPPAQAFCNECFGPLDARGECHTCDQIPF